MTRPAHADLPPDRRLRISFISQWYAPEFGDGGVPRRIAVALRDCGHQVQVLTGFPNYPEGKLYPGYRLRPYLHEKFDGLSVHRAPLVVSHDTSARRRAMNYLSFAVAGAAVGLTRLPSTDVSLVYSSPITAAIPAMALRRFRGTPYALLIQDMWPHSVPASGFLTKAQNRRIEPALQRVCDRIYRAAAQIAAISPGMLDLLIERGVPSDKLHLVPNWADEAAYYPAGHDPLLRQQLGLTRRFTVMYAGNLGEAQGLQDVLRAANLLRNRRDIGFAFVGAGSAEASLRQYAKTNGLDNVVFIQPQPAARMSAVLATAEVQLVSLRNDPIFHNTLPSKLQTIMAAGQPILGFIAGDGAKIIAAAGAGSTAPPGDFTELAAVTAQLSALEPKALRQMGMAGNRYYYEHFASAAAVTKLNGILSLAAEQTSRRDRDRGGNARVQSRNRD